MKKRFYISFAKIFPQSYRNFTSQLLIRGGEKNLSSDDWLGSANLLALLGLLAFTIAPLSLFREFSLKFLFYGISFGILVHFLSFIILYLKMEDRKERIEAALPDLLQLTASNIKSGMTPFKALRFSAKEEFGPLKEEIEYISSKTMGAVNFSEVLLGINKRVSSDILERTLRLFSNALKTGGHLAQLLEDIAKDIIETRTLKKELVTSTRAYTMFILFMVILGAPLLLSIALAFLDNIIALQPETNTTGEEFGVGGIIESVNIDPSFMLQISIIMLVINSVLASVLMGVIKEGSIFYGFRYSIFITIASITAFFIFNFLTSGFLA
jgi:Flp pilus assembly protein TadB